MLKFSKRAPQPDEILLTTGELEALSPTPRPAPAPPSRPRAKAPIFARRAQQDSDDDAMTHAFMRRQLAPPSPSSITPVAMMADASASHGVVLPPPSTAKKTLVRALVLMASGASVGVLIAMVLQARAPAPAPAAAAPAETAHVAALRPTQPASLAPAQLAPAQPSPQGAPAQPLVVPTTPAKPVVTGTPITAAGAPAASAPVAGVTMAPLTVVPPAKGEGASAPHAGKDAPAKDAKDAKKGVKAAAPPPPPVAGKATTVNVLKGTVSKTPTPAGVGAPRKSEKDEDILKRAQQTTSDTL